MKPCGEANAVGKREAWLLAVVRQERPLQKWRSWAKAARMRGYWWGALDSRGRDEKQNTYAIVGWFVAVQAVNGIKVDNFSMFR